MLTNLSLSATKSYLYSLHHLHYSVARKDIRRNDIKRWKINEKGQSADR